MPAIGPQYGAPTPMARRGAVRLGCAAGGADGSLLHACRGDLPRPRARVARREPSRDRLAARPRRDARLAAEAARRGVPRRRVAEGIRRRGTLVDGAGDPQRGADPRPRPASGERDGDLVGRTGDHPPRRRGAGVGDRLERARERAERHRGQYPLRPGARLAEDDGARTAEARGPSRPPARRRPRHQGRDPALGGHARADRLAPRAHEPASLGRHEAHVDEPRPGVLRGGDGAARSVGRADGRSAARARRPVGEAVPLRPRDDDRRRDERGPAEHRRPARARPAEEVMAVRPAAVVRAPRPALRPFISIVWVSDRHGAADGDASDRERMLGSGATHLVFRLSDHPVRLYDDLTERTGTSVGHAVVGGARATFYLRDTPRRVRTVGAVLLPGAAALLFGAPADELAGRHTPLLDLWGRSAVEEARERLLEAADPERQLELFEALLAA